MCVEVRGGWRSRESKEARISMSASKRLASAVVSTWSSNETVSCICCFSCRPSCPRQPARRCWSFHVSRAGLATCKKVVGACGHEDNCEDVPVSAKPIWIEDSSRYSIKVPTYRGCMVVYRRMVGTGASFPPTCGFYDIYIG